MFRYLLYLAAFAFVVWTVGSALTQVQSHERAVIRRFGRVLDNKPEQGLYIGLPWGIDRVDLAPVGREQSVTVGFDDKDEKDEEVAPPGQLLTGDHNLVNVRVSINYRVGAGDADVERYVLQRDQVDAFVTRAAESLLAEWIGGRKVDDVLRMGKVELPRFLHEQLQARIQPYELGIEVGQVSILKLDPPEQVKDAFDLVAREYANKSTRTNRADQERERRMSKARAEADSIRQLAESYARQEKVSARADADSFTKRLEQYTALSQKNPDYLNSLWLDDMTRLFTKMRENGQIQLLDHFLTSEGLSITEFPLQRKK